MKKLLSVTVFSGLLALAKMLAGFIVAKVVAVYTGPSGIAILGQLQGFNNVITNLTSAPVGSGLVKYTAKYHEEGFAKCQPWWKASIQLTMLTCCIVIPLLIILSGNISRWLFGGEDYSIIIITFALLLPLTTLGTLINSIINGQQNYKRYIVLGATSVSISTVIMISAVYVANIKGALVAVSLQGSVIGLVMLITSLKEKWIKYISFDINIDREKVKDITQYIIMAVVIALCSPMALIAIRKILVNEVGWDLAGQWQAVWKISEAYLAILSIALSTYFLPKLSSLKSGGEVKREVIKTFVLVAPFACALALAVYLLRDITIDIIFTSDFSPARNLFLVQLIGDVFKISSWVLAFPMISQGKTRWLVSTEIIFSILFVALSWWFITTYGVHGANYAYLTTYILYFILMAISLPKIAR